MPVFTEKVGRPDTNLIKKMSAAAKISCCLAVSVRGKIPKLQQSMGCLASGDINDACKGIVEEQLRLYIF